MKVIERRKKTLAYSDIGGFFAFFFEGNDGIVTAFGILHPIKHCGDEGSSVGHPVMKSMMGWFKFRYVEKP